MDWFLQSDFLLYLSGLFNVPHSPINTSTFSTPKYFLSNILTHLYSNEHIKGQRGILNLLGYIGMQTGEWSSKESNNLLTYSTPPSCDIKSLTFWTCYSHVDNVGSNDKTLVTQAKLLVHDQCGGCGLRCCTDVPARHLQSCLPVKTRGLRGW